MSVEHLQQLNVGGNYGDQIPLVPALQLGGTEPAQRPEYLVPDESQQLEGDEMVAGLLRIAEEAPYNRKDYYTDKKRREGERGIEPQSLQHRIAAEDGDKGGAEMAHNPHKNGKKHITGQRLHQPDQPGHYLESASFFHARIHAFSPSFP